MGEEAFKPVSSMGNIKLRSVRRHKNVRQRRKDGSIGNKRRAEYRVRKVCREKLVNLLESRSDATLAELAEPFGVSHLDRLSSKKDEDNT